MKKLLILLVTLSAFACGDGSKQNEGNTQSETNTEREMPTTDETMSPDTTSQMNESDTTMTDGGGAVQP